MSTNNSNQKTTMLAKIEEINRVEGFDPSPFAVDFNDLVSGETRKRLPVMTQIAWFRMKHPYGKIAVQVTPAKECFVAVARIYPSYKDPADCYLAEATASRGYCADKPSVSPREWAQTAAIGVALRNAGFGLQFAIAGEDFEPFAPNEFEENGVLDPEQNQSENAPKEYIVTEPPVRELTEEEKVELALKIPCPISKFNGKTLGDVLTLDPKALTWIATKYTGDESIKAAAQCICDYAVGQTSA